MRKNGFTVVEIIIAVVAIGLIGFLGYQIFQKAGDNEPSLSVSSTKDLADYEQDFESVLELQEITARVLEEEPTSEVAGIELEADDASLVYVVHMNSGNVLVFNALTGEKLELNDNDNDELDDDSRLPSSFVAGVSLSEAINIAKQERPDSTLRKVEIEVEDGVLVYSVRFTDDSRVDVRAEDGEIQRLRDETGNDLIKRDDDNDDDGEDNNEDGDNDGDDDDSERDDDDDTEEDESDDDDDRRS